jgi:hypothetical protein
MSTHVPAPAELAVVDAEIDARLAGAVVGRVERLALRAEAHLGLSVLPPV